MYAYMCECMSEVLWPHVNVCVCACVLCVNVYADVYVYVCEVS